MTTPRVTRDRPRSASGARARQALRRRRGGARHRPRRRRRRDVRLPRPERGRQVDDDLDAVHAAGARRRQRARRRPRRRARARRRAPQHRPRLPGPHARRLPDRRAEPALPRRAVRRAEAIVPERMRLVLEMVGLWERRSGARADLLGRHEAPPGDRARAAARAPRAVPRRADGRARPADAQLDLGLHRGAEAQPRTSRSSSPRTTWTRPSTATGSRSSTRAE